LFSTTSTSGAFCTQAKLRPSWKAPVEVPPSPIQLSATVRLPFIRSAITAPVRIGIMSPSIEITAGMLPSSESQPKCTLRSRPRVGPVALAMYWRRISTGSAPITSMEPRLRMSGDRMSWFLPRASA
jgi:hypothetical protein